MDNIDIHNIILYMKMIRLKKDSFYIYALIGICLIFLLLKLEFLNPKVVWDESVYLGMGKHIYSGGSSGLWEMIRPLGLPLVTGFFWKIGLNQIIASRIFSIMISLGCIIAAYLIAKELFDKKHALISALIMACTPIFFLYSDYILTDHISTLFLMLSILFLLKDRAIVGGIFGGLAFWFKFTSILYIIALMLFIIYKFIRYKFIRTMIKNKTSIWQAISSKEIKKYLYVTAIIVLFVGAYFFSNYLLYKAHFGAIDAIFKPYLDAAAYSNNPYQNTVVNSIHSLIYYIFYYPYNIIFNHAYGSLIYVFLLIYFIRCSTFVKNKLNESHILMLFVFFTYLVHFSIIPYKVDRFWITFLPFMAIYSSFGIFWLMNNNKLWKSNRHSKYPRIIVITIVIILFGMTLYKDSQIYESNRWNKINTESIVSDKTDNNVETYFDTHNIQGPILVTNPMFAAYSDKRYIGAYDVLNKNGLFVNDWEANINFNAVAYMDSSIPCLETDTRCVVNKEKLKDMITTNFRKTDSYVYDGVDVTFYMK